MSNNNFDQAGADPFDDDDVLELPEGADINDDPWDVPDGTYDVRILVVKVKHKGTDKNGSSFSIIEFIYEVTEGDYGGEEITEGFFANARSMIVLKNRCKVLGIDVENKLKISSFVDSECNITIKNKLDDNGFVKVAVSKFKSQ